MNAKFHLSYISVGCIDFDFWSHPRAWTLDGHGHWTGVQCHGMKVYPIWYLWSKYECFLISVCQDMDL